MHRVEEVRALDPLEIWLRFEDGSEGVLDVASLLPEGSALERLRSPEAFRKVRLLKSFGAIEWPGGIDLDPDLLYSKLCGLPVDRVLRRKA